MIIKPFGPIVGAFIQDDVNRVQVIKGPVGSAKSTGAAAKGGNHAYKQAPDADGVARVRVGIVRNSNRQLRDTTLKTWLQVFPENEYGPFHWTQMTHHWKFKPKGRDYLLDAEFVFRPLDDANDITNLLSAEYTFAWFNEVREIDEEILNHMGRRVGRYPAHCTWHGWFGDTNAFDVQHHLYDKLVVNPRAGWKLYEQPGGLDLGAENIENLPGGRQYYLDALADYSPADADIYVHAKFGASRHGKPVFVSYNDTAHCQPFNVDKNAPLYVGYDCSGQHPAAVVAQKTVAGQWRVLREFAGEDIGTKAHAEALRRYLAAEFPGVSIGRITCDPAGAAKDAHAMDNIRIIRETFRGVPTFKALTNDPRTRIEAVDGCFRRMINGGPAIVIHPDCKALRRACISEYRYRKLKLPGNQYADEPQKLHPWSDLCDALQYLLLGGGEGRAAMGGGQWLDETAFVEACNSRNAAIWDPMQ